MRQFSTICVLAAAATVSAVVPHTFSSGKTAVAQDVNENFVALDTAIQNRATSATVTGIQASVTALQTGKASTEDLAKVKASILPPVDVTGKADQKWVRDTLKAKADTGKVSTLATQVNALQTTTASIGANYFPKSGISGTVGTIPKFAPGSTLANSSITDNGAGGLFFGGATGWNAGLVSTTSADKGAAWSVANPSQSWSFQIRGDGLDGSAVNSWNIVDETAGHIRLSGNAAGLNVLTPLTVQGNSVYHTGNLNPAKYVSASGGTISGDLRISGKLTTNPGAEPADYVFEPDYKLASLSEVEAFTKANKHLPEVPSASEMTKNGVDVAAMNMVLLKKVEELTLHAIALQKDMDAQKAQFEERLRRLESTSR